MRMDRLDMRILELAEELKVEISDMIAVCILLEIPASSRISCLTKDHIEQLVHYYENQN